MADYALTGKKGTGKSKNAIRIICDEYFKQGRKVATNLDIFLEPMLGPHSKQTYVRIPDKPNEFDLLAVGHGNPDTYDEDKAGGMFLDELGTWMNTRSFADKTRAGMLDYLAHARKHGFNCYYIMQNVVQVDKQLRESFIEFTTRHTRFDKVQWPFIGGALAALFGRRAGYMPRFHTAVTRIGFNPQDLKTESAWFICDELNKCYDTRQIFDANYSHGTHSVLSPWHVKGRFLEPAVLPWYVRLRKWARGDYVVKPTARPARSAHPSLARVLMLVQALPEDQAVSIVSRFVRALEAAEGHAALR